MAGRRILDVAALFNASRSVAQKHVALRSRQLDVWSKTSSVAKAITNQTDRVTDTAKAAIVLASSLNDNTSSWTAEPPQPAAYSSIPGRESTESRISPSRRKESVLEDHFYEKSERNTSIDSIPTEAVKLRQEKAAHCPLPDGSIPPASSLLNVPVRDCDLLSSPPPSPSKNPLQEESRFGERVLRPASSGTSTIPIPAENTPFSTSDKARNLQRQFENQIPAQPTDAEEGHSKNSLAKDLDEDSFYEPSNHTSPVLSSLPRVKIPKQTENTQGDRESLQNNGINSDSYSSASTILDSTLTTQVTLEQGQIPEGVNTDLFNSPRVAKILGGRTHASKNRDFGMEVAEKIQPLLDFQPSSADQESFSRPETVATEADYERIKDEYIGREVSKIPNDQSSVASSVMKYEMRESKVPSSRIGRLWNYGGLAAGMFGGAISESLRRATGNGGDGSYMLSAGNMDRLVAKLSRMRGAALKLGQMMSFQDSKMLPAPIQEVLLRVQDSADYMPPSQRNKVLASNLGDDWRDLFSYFDEKPIAAASIGQVHSATLKSTGERVAVKVQYPGVANSIDSDLSNLAVLLTASRLLPKGLYLEKTIANARTELAWECDYIREAECGKRFRTLLADEMDVFVVPKIYPEASGRQVLTMAYMDGIGVTKVQNLTQEQKDWIGTQILRLCLREITEFRFMQTDPNWTNFLYNSVTKKLELLDFGASREFPEEFILRYTKLLLAASKSDRATVRKLSVELGYLTGHESKAMLNAHIASVLTLAEPFLVSSPEVYDFRDQTITERVKTLIPVMVRERLSPPPEETYSLHRKLSGAFLLCARLGSRVRCRDLFEKSIIKARLG